MMNRCEPKRDDFAVGLELERVERGSQCQEEADTDVMPHIMHREVATTLFDCVVRYSIPAETLAETLRVAPSHLDALYDEGSKNSVVKVSPPSVVEARHGRGADKLSPPRIRYEGALNDVNGYETNSKRGEAEVGRFAKALHSRLERVAKERYGERFMDVGKRNGGERCGFSSCVHRGVFVLSNGVAVVRNDKGIYGSCLSAGMIVKRRTYFEVLVLDDCEAGGVCVGVARTGKSPGLVGGDEESIGLHSSGKLVQNGQFEEFGKGYGSGDFVGVSVEVSDDHTWLQFSVNGFDVGAAVCVSIEHELCAAVSMLRKGSKTLLFCCASQWCGAASNCAALCDAC